MSTVLAEIAGKIITALGYDGVAFRNILVDADGNLQIDVLESALAAGAATEATLATRATEAKLELCRALLSSIDLETDNVRIDLAALLTELRLKADLTETQPISAVALPLPAGASTSAKQDSLIAKFQDQAFTYKAQVYGRVTHTKVGAGSYTMTGAAVPADEIWVVSAVAAYNWNSAMAALYLGFDKAATQYWIAGTGTLAAKAAYNTYSPMYLVEGDKVAAFFSACSGGDALAMMYNGYSMTLD